VVPSITKLAMAESQKPTTDIRHGRYLPICAGWRHHMSDFWLSAVDNTDDMFNNSKPYLKMAKE